MSDHHPSASLLLREAVDDLPVDVDRLVRGGVTRGRTIRRRRRVGASLAAVAVVGVIGVAASVGPGLVDDARGGLRGPEVATAPDPTSDATTDPAPTAPTTPPLGEVDATLVVATADVPATIGDLLGGTIGATDTSTGSEPVDEPQRQIVHFLYEGTQTTFEIERADSLASCAALVDPADQPDGLPGGECVVRDGVELLLSGPEVGDGVTGQAVMAWRHGYIVSLGSSNSDAKEGSVVTDEPPISMAELEKVVLSDVWFSGS